jgi:excisionase family DNA binding protein
MIAVIFNKLDGKRYAKLYKENESNKFDFEIKVKAKDLKNDFGVDITDQPDQQEYYFCLCMIDVSNTFRLAEINDNNNNQILGFDNLRYKCFEFVRIESYDDIIETVSAKTKQDPPNISYEKIEPFKKQFESLMTGNELALILGITKRSIYSYVKAGRLNGIKAGREWLFSKEHLENFMEEEKKRALNKRNKKRTQKEEDQE